MLTKYLNWQVDAGQVQVIAATLELEWYLNQLLLMKDLIAEKLNYYRLKPKGLISPKGDWSIRNNTGRESIDDRP